MEFWPKKNSTLEKMTNKTCQKIKVSHDFGSKSQKVWRKDDKPICHMRN